MANPQQFDLLTRSVHQWNDWYKAGGISADLTGADLSGRNLTYQREDDSTVLGVELIMANLSDANLSDADLSHAVLYGATLIGAHLNGATLVGTDLSRANLSGADLRGAQGIETANLTAARVTATTNYDPGVDLRGRGAIFSVDEPNQAPIEQRLRDIKRRAYQNYCIFARRVQMGVRRNTLITFLGIVLPLVTFGLIVLIRDLRDQTHNEQILQTDP
jgi:hypothetical protein